MSLGSIHKGNVGRIAERIVANELEYRGYRVSDLNREGVSANADLLAAKGGCTWQLQVKGATEDQGWWLNYGYCTEEVISGNKPMFNSAATSFYKAAIVVLVCVKSPQEYVCVVLPIERAEACAQLNLDYSFRKLKRDGSAKKPGKVWSPIGYLPTPKDPSSIPLMKQEQAILEQYQDNWAAMGSS